MTKLGLIFPPDQPPEQLRATARAVDCSALDELWLWEDCFAESGIAAAAVALESTNRVTVGIGLLPVPLRNVGLTAMELATLARLFPGRLLPGIGHGVLEWMGQAGVRARSPLTLLREYGTALRALLDGEKVTVEGEYVRLDGVQLRWPPEQRLPLYSGAGRQKTVALAATISDGLIFAPTEPEQLSASLRIAEDARRAAGIGTRMETTCFLPVPLGMGAAEIAERVRSLADAGADRVPICVVETDGPPLGDARLLDAVPVLDDVRAMLA